MCYMKKYVSDYLNKGIKGHFNYEFDKSYVVLTIDDGNKYWGKVYDMCHSLGVPLCVATIPENLNLQN